MPNNDSPMTLPILARARQAIQVLRGDAKDSAKDQERAIIPLTYPTAAPGVAQATLVRTANPQEYKPEGASIRVQGFNKHPVVHACIRVVSDIVASVPLIVLRERGNYESRVPDTDPLQRLLDYPNTRMTARQFRARYAVDFMGYGNSFFQLQRPSPGRPPVAIKAINPESIQSVWVDREGDAHRYDYGDWSGIIIQVPAEDVLHFKDLEMSRPFTPDVFGFPRGATALASIAADNEATNYVRQVVTNDGTPTFAVLLADEATQDDATAMQERYRARVVDRGKRGTPAFFGAVRDIKPLGFTLSDLEFPDLRRVSREDICAAFGVDPRMIGIASASSDAGLSGVQYAEARARLVQHTIEPMLNAIEDEINHWLAPEFGDVWVSYDREMLRELVENDTETSTRIRAEFAASLRTFEESRAALRLPPMPNPTEALAIPMGTTLTPAAVAVIDPRSIADQVAPDAPSPETPAPDTEDAMVEARQLRRALSDTSLSGDQVEQLLELLESVVEKELPAAAVKALIKAAFPKLDPALVDEMLVALEGFEPPAEEPEAPETPEDTTEESAAVPSEDNVAPSARWWEQMSPEELRRDRRYQYWERAMDELNKREAGYYKTAMDRFASERTDVAGMFGVTTRASKTNEQILREIERRIAEDYAPGGAYYEAWRANYEKLIGEVYMVGARQAGGVGLSFSLESPQVLAAIDRRAKRLAELVGDTTAKNILAAIRAAELAGFSIAETGRLVQATVFNERITDIRATAIARTESAGAMSQGSWDQAKEMGDLYQSKEWLAFEDQDTRLSHTECMAQGIIPIDATFTNGLEYPLDPAGDAEEVINCRCVLAYYDTPAS